MKLQLIITIALLIASSLLFILAPQIDKSVTRTLFQIYHFRMPYNSLIIVRNSLWPIIYLMSTILLITLMYGIMKHNLRAILAPLFIVFVFSLGPGVIVNMILKDHSGRPRPYQTNLYGGNLTFQKSWEFSHECNSNCSFVGGESSCAFALFSLLFLIKKRRRKILAGIIISMYFATISYIRLTMGGHYLSDIVIGAILIYLVILGCYQLFLIYLPKKLTRGCQYQQTDNLT